jgi:hypothetical protein
LSGSDAKLKFRFHSANDLNFLFIGLHFPQKFIVPRVGRKFSGEEVFLSGIYRLAFPNRFDDDGWKIRFGFDHQTASQAVSLFYRFMVRNWAYLLFDNLEFWLPFIPRFNQAIRLKCSELGCQYDDLKIFGFIDNTLNSTCVVRHVMERMPHEMILTFKELTIPDGRRCMDRSFKLWIFQME